MTRENGDGDVAADAPPRPQEASHDNENEDMHCGDALDDDGDESDDDFELETMEDDAEDDEDCDDDSIGLVDEEEDDEEDEEEAIEAEEDASVGSLDDELMALVDDAAGSGVGSPGDDRIAHRTRTKVSLVDVDIDLLESLLPPDPVKSSDIFNADSHEYQRFLSSLLPTGIEGDNLSFLDEEDEEYEPEEDEDDEEMDDDEVIGMRSGGRGERDYDLHQQSVRVSKKELTELLWDSTQLTQLKVPPTFPKTATGAFTTNVATSAPGGDVAGQTVEDLTDAAALKDVKGTITQQQCIQLASQMHKHFQLLLQTYYLITASVNGPPDRRTEKRNLHEDPEVLKAAEAAAKAAAKEQLEECESMLRELQIRGKRALQHKAQLLSKLTMNNGTGGSSASADDMLEQRRVTRSISAAHAAVAHPSMFDIVGSQSIDQLTDKFQRGCSISERNQGLQSCLQELDKHILLNRKKRRRPQGRSKVVFTQPEDRLLFQGVKRHGVSAEAWREIHETLMPTKDPAEISKRYRYLCSRKKRGGPSAFKEYHSEHHTRKWAEWMLEEDVRVARGVVEYHGDNRRFARISSKYLPHRHRLEIRKRWERLKRRYLMEDGGVAEDDPSMTPIASARVFAVAVKQFFETKLRDEVKTQSAVVVEAASRILTGRNKRASKKKKKPVPVQEDAGDSDADAREPTLEVTGCGLKNLHPALFFSSWAVINPATLLQNTCEHNWPAFIDEKRQDITSESTLDMVSRTAVSRVEEETAEHRATLASEHQQLQTIDEEEDEDDDHHTSDALNFSVDTVDSDDEDDADEESDFEQDELLSSGSEDTNSEYERLEMSDDDEEEEDQDQDEDVRDEDGSHTMDDPRLWLENLRQPSKIRAKRALEALERRLIGSKRAIGDETGSGFQVPATAPLVGARAVISESTDFATPAASLEVDDNLDLFAYEELRENDDDDEDDDGFEQDELQSSSSSKSEAESDDELISAAAERSKRTRDAATAEPLKRVKLPRCPDCGSSPCVCASVRMQRLLQRIRPQDGVHDTHLSND